MLSLTRIQLLSFAAAGALVALTATSPPARSEERPVHLGRSGLMSPLSQRLATKTSSPSTCQAMATATSKS